MDQKEKKGCKGNRSRMNQVSSTRSSLWDSRANGEYEVLLKPLSVLSDCSPYSDSLRG